MFLLVHARNLLPHTVRLVGIVGGRFARKIRVFRSSPEATMYRPIAGRSSPVQVISWAASTKAKAIKVDLCVGANHLHGVSYTWKKHVSDPTFHSVLQHLFYRFWPHWMGAREKNDLLVWPELYSLLLHMSSWDYFPKISWFKLSSNFFYVTLCDWAKNSCKCLKYFIFHFFSHIFWKSGLPLCFIDFMLSLRINLLVKNLLALCFYVFCKKFAIYMFVWRFPKKLNCCGLLINGSFSFQPLMSLKYVLTWTPCMLERTEIDGVT